MRVLVPFAAETPKTRLESVLSPAERAAFARAMLADVLRAIVEAGHEPTILATAPLELAAPGLELPDDVATAVSVTVDDRPLTDAVNARLPDGDATTVGSWPASTIASTTSASMARAKPSRSGGDSTDSRRVFGVSAANGTTTRI